MGQPRTGWADIQAEAGRHAGTQAKTLSINIISIPRYQRDPTHHVLYKISVVFSRSLSWRWAPSKCHAICILLHTEFVYMCSSQVSIKSAWIGNLLPPYFTDFLETTGSTGSKRCHRDLQKEQLEFRVWPPGWWQPGLPELGVGSMWHTSHISGHINNNYTKWQ